MMHHATTNPDTQITGNVASTPAQDFAHEELGTSNLDAVAGLT